MNELINNFYKLKEEKESIDQNIKELKQQSDSLACMLDDLRNQITGKLREQSLESFTTDQNYIAVYSEKLSTTWVDEEQIKKQLLENGYGKFLKSKTTQSLDKNAIKKALKTDSELYKLVANSIVQEPKQSALITTVENYEKMLSEMQNVNE